MSKENVKTAIKSLFKTLGLKKRGKSALCERGVRGSYYLRVSSNGKGGEGAPIPMTAKILVSITLLVPWWKKRQDFETPASLYSLTYLWTVICSKKTKITFYTLVRPFFNSKKTPISKWIFLVYAMKSVHTFFVI